MNVHAGFVSLKPNPTKGPYEYATVWLRRDQEVVHQFVEHDAVTSKLIYGHGEYLICLLE